MFRLTRYILAPIVVLTAGTAWAQQSSQGAERFGTEVEAVEIDVRVTDKKGSPVTGLTGADFEVFEDGVKQNIRVFTPVKVPFDPRPRTALTIEPDVQTNRLPFNGRVYVFVLDDLHTHPLRTQRVRAAVRQFLDRHFGANDRAAIVTTSGRPETVQDLTSSRAALLAAVDAFTGRAIRSSTLERINEYFRLQQVREIGERGSENNRTVKVNDPLEPERVYQARGALRQLEDVARWLDTVPTQRKALIFVSEGIDYDLTNLVENRFAGGLLEDVRQVIARATRSNANIYAIDPRGLGGLFDETIEVSSLPDDTTVLGPGIFMQALQWTQNNLRILAEESGGFALVNTNDLASGFDRIVRESSEYYLLGYQPANTRRDGRFRRVEVRVKRPELQVQSRRGYFAPSDNRRDTKQTSVALAVLNSPIPVTGLTISSAATMFRGEANKASVVTTMEVGPEVSLTQSGETYKGRVEFSVVAVNLDGRIVASATPAIDLNLRPATRDAVTTHGVRATARLELKPGRYQIRIAARDPNSNKAGSVMHELRVPDFSKTAVAMSDLVLASTGATRVVTANLDPQLKQVLVVPPTTIRQFTREETVTVLAELYDNRKHDVRPLRVTTSVIDSRGRVVHRSEEPVEAFSFEPERRSYRHTANVPMRDFAPGEYVVRVVVSGVEDARATKEVAIAVHDEHRLAESTLSATN
jgi:VWFA-related protein